MPDWWPALWDRALTIYGRMPYHPGKWRVVEGLAPKASASWVSPRLARRRMVEYELDLRYFIPRHVFYGIYEVWETRCIERTVKPGWVVVDAGANIGCFSLLFARLVGSNGKVHAFEPVKSTHDALRRNIKLNSAANVCTYRVALSDTCGEVALLSPDGNDPGKTRVACDGERGSEMTQSMTLDTFVEEHNLDRLDFIKVDIEGSELRFLTGAAKTLARFRPIVMIELNPSAIARFGSSVDRLVAYLREFGYRLRCATWYGLRPLDVGTSSLTYLNAFAFPERTPIS
jgi:FkbM family methyltransferase